MTEEIKQIKQTLDTWQHIVDFGYGTIEVPDKTKIFKTISNLIDKQQEEIERLKNAEEYAKLGKETLLDAIHKQEKKLEELKKYDYRNIKIDDNNKIYSIHFTKEQLHLMNFGIALYVSMQNFDKLNDKNDI